MERELRVHTDGAGVQIISSQDVCKELYCEDWLDLGLDGELRVQMDGAIVQLNSSQYVCVRICMGTEGIVWIRRWRENCGCMWTVPVY